MSIWFKLFLLKVLCKTQRIPLIAETLIRDKVKVKVVEMEEEGVKVKDFEGAEMAGTMEEGPTVSCVAKLAI